jgi:serine phosphatase RsbU (regulator of sigma subunit)/CHASE2 domain-containing sensor protein
VSSVSAEAEVAHIGDWSLLRPRTWFANGQGRLVAVLVTVLLALYYAFLGQSDWERGRNVVFDTYQTMAPRQVQALHVVIVDIDEASVAALGQWPWPRTRLARLLEATHQLGARAIGLDILMPEADRLSPGVFMEERPDVSLALRHELLQLPANDTLLAETLQRTPVVLGRAGTSESKVSPVPVDDAMRVRTYGGEPPLAYVHHYNGHMTNLPQLELAAPGHGYLNTEPDQDGVVRLVPLLVAVQEALAPTLVLELLRVAGGQDSYRVHVDDQGIRGIQIGDTLIRTEPDGRLRLHFSKVGPRQHISALHILQGIVPAERVQNKIAIIGVTALGLVDLVSTPVATRMDGVEVQAQALENILSNTRLVRPFLAPWLELLAFLVSALLLIIILPRVRPGVGVALCLTSALLVCTSGFVAFSRWQLLFDPSFASAGNAVVLVVLLTTGFAASNRRRRELRATLELERLARSRIEGELQAARDIQMGMLPAPWAITGLPEHLAFHALLEPAREVGGDLYDAFMLDEDHFFFIVGDVSGKGVPASLFMALTKTLCKSLALRQRMPLNNLITALNQEVARDNPQALFVTAIAGILDVRTGEMELCSAGHEAPILLRSSAAPCSLTVTGGPPLCILENFAYPVDRIRLQLGDLLLMLTDGVTEAQDVAQTLYGLERVMAYCSTIQDEPEQRGVLAVCHGLYDDVKRFVRDAEPFDDITIMAIRFTAPTAATSPD